MNLIFTSLLVFSIFCTCLLVQISWKPSKADAVVEEKSLVLLAIIARNEEKTLPIYLGYIERLEYPKQRISVFIQTDHNEDKTELRLREWIKHATSFYHKVTINSNSSEQTYNDSNGPNDWSPSRYQQVLRLRQTALDEAKHQNADYIFFVDCDNFLINPNTLNAMMEQKKLIIAPMIRVFDNETAYSNYWCGMDEQGYYKRTAEYMPILHREKKGCFEVPMVHSTYLIDLRHESTQNLRYNPPPNDYKGEIDDILVMAHSAKKLGIKLYILNEVEYGRMLTPATASMSIEDDQTALIDAKVDWMAYFKPLVLSNYVNHRPPLIDNLGFDEIYMINLARRPDRKKKMLMSAEELGILFNEQDAVDGRTLTKEKLDKKGIYPMKNFKDPYLERPITMGEVGCFLSHWNVWQEVIKHQLDIVLVLEDDIRFQPNFKRKLKFLFDEAKQLLRTVQWDLIYIGRKRMSRSEEMPVEGTETLVWARYSYWTLGYILTLSGAEKLVAGQPLGQMIPVDEYIPIMFNDHTDAELMEKFPVRNIVALSANPLLVYPTHYVGEEGYISDTEMTAYVEETAMSNTTTNGETDTQETLKPVALKHTSTQSNNHGEL